jgi:TonB-linked SusC/RagA family outer membrane protein
MKVYDTSNPVCGCGKVPSGFQGSNDVQVALGNYTRNETYQGLLTVNLDAEITKGLLFRAVLGLGITGTNNYYYNYPADIGFGPSIEDFGKSLSKDEDYIATYTLSYDRSFGDHSIKALAGYEARRSDYSDLAGYNTNPLVPVPQDFSLVQTTTTATVSGHNSTVEDRVLSQFGRLEYSYRSKYLLTGTIRRDGLASKFGPNHRYGTFPGISAGWKISQEKFMERLPFISSLKLRAGYGLLGNSVGPSFAYSAAYGTGYTYDYGGGRLNSVNIIDRLPNADIKWETVATTNIGLDIGLLKEKLLVNLDYYSRQTKDMIYGVGISPSAGLGTNVPANIGQMSNKGFEFNIEYRDVVSKDFNYSIGFNGAHNTNRLVTLDPSLGKLFLTNGALTEIQNYAVVSRSEPGRELANFYGYRVLGIYQDNTGAAGGPSINGGYKPVAGDLIYDDINKDGVIDANDKVYIGSPWPKLTYGINLKLAYKKFDLNAFFNGVAGVDLYNGFDSYQHIFFNDYSSSPKIFDVSGFAGNAVTSVPRIGTLTDYDKNLNWTSVNSYHVQSASYLRLKNVQLGYNFSPEWLSRAKVSSLKIFVMGDNLFTITGYDGMNPDLGIGTFLDKGIDNASYRYPVSRIFTIGVNAEF